MLRGGCFGNGRSLVCATNDRLTGNLNAVSDFEPKKLSSDGIARALERVERYRLMNQPAVAESICYDILSTDPDNQHAIRGLLLSLTDQFDQHQGPGIHQALDLIPRLSEEYERAYCSGLINERQARARLSREYPGAHFDAFDLLMEAMRWFENADTLRVAGNEDARLHWNTCIRVIANNNLRQRPTDDTEPAHD